VKTERLLLEPWRSSDWQVFRPIATDVEVMRYINGGIPWTDEKIQSFVNKQVILYSERGFCRWKIIEPSTGDLIGFCGPGMWRDAEDPEIGWWLARSHWGRGLATEAARAALQDALERVQLKRIISIAMPENVASIGIMKKLGLKFEAEFESDRIRLVRYAIENHSASFLPPGRKQFSIDSPGSSPPRSVRES
jgi:ribosomal-protein-alanine N-acetyltransferase